MIAVVIGIGSTMFATLRTALSPDDMTIEQAFAVVLGALTLMGLAISKKRAPGEYSLTYHAPQPRAVLRIVHPDDITQVMPYGEYGRVELTTMTKEFFMPRFLERDEAIRRAPCDEFPWDGVGDVRPFQSGTKTVIEGVY